MAAPLLALESGERRRDPHLITFAALVASVAMLVTFGGLLAAWLSLRSGTPVWPPKGVTIENYFGTVLSVTMFLGCLAAGWIVYGVKKEERTQAISASVVLIVLGLGFLNLLTYVLQGSHFGPATHPYGAIYFAFNVLMAAAVVIALLLTLVTLARYVGGQVSATEPALAWSTAWFWWATTLAWLVLYAAVYVVK